MPNYTYRCRECGNRLELMQTVKVMRETRTRLRCQKCEGALEFIFPAPALHTDTTFFANRDDGFGLDDVARKRAYAKARREGTDIGGKTWMPGLNAWVGSKAEVKAIAAVKGYGVDGAAIKAPAPEPIETPPKPYQVAEEIVQDEVERVVEEDYGNDVTPRERKELVGATRTRLRGKQHDQ